MRSKNREKALTMELSEADVFVLGCYAQDKLGLEFLLDESGVRMYLAGIGYSQRVPPPEEALQEAWAAYGQEWKSMSGQTTPDSDPSR